MRRGPGVKHTDRPVARELSVLPAQQGQGGGDLLPKL